MCGRERVYVASSFQFALTYLGASYSLPLSCFSFLFYSIAHKHPRVKPRDSPDRVRPDANERVYYISEVYRGGVELHNFCINSMPREQLKTNKVGK